MERSEHDRAVRRLIVVAVVVASVMVISVRGVGVVLFTRLRVAVPLSDSHPKIDAEAVQRQFAADYPGWTPVDNVVRSYTEDGHAISEYSIAARPPERDYTIGIVYEAFDDGSWFCRDDVLRPGAVYEERAEALYAVLEREFVSQDKEMRYVTTLPGGEVIVEWVRYSGSGFGRRAERDLDLLYYIDTEETWLMVP
jgi:hypothetical protein